MASSSIDSRPAERDRQFMLSALSLAAGGEGFVEPNPMVGCIIARGDHLLAGGFHRRFGGPHAEIDALQSFDRLPPGHSSLEGLTIYVTLEPCCHRGKTPPCTETLIKRRPARVVVAAADPNPAVNGRGIAALRSAGIEVEVGVAEKEAIELTAPFRKIQQHGLPWIIAKWAMTLDGKIACAGGDSRWISNVTSRGIVHQLRGRVDAVLVGANTVRTDDPMLDVRDESALPVRRTSTRVVLDSHLRLPIESRVFQTAAQLPTIVFCGGTADADRRSDLESLGVEVIPIAEMVQPARWRQILSALADRSMTNVLVEGGGQILGSLFDSRLVDECHVFVAPKVIGGDAALSPVAGKGVASMAAALQLPNRRIEVLDGDIYFRGRFGDSQP